MQDVLLDDLGRGVAELGEIARTIQREIAVGSAVADEVASKTDALNAKLKSANRRLDEVIEQVFFRFCNSQTLLINRFVLEWRGDAMVPDRGLPHHPPCVRRLHLSHRLILTMPEEEGSVSAGRIARERMCVCVRRYRS